MTRHLYRTICALVAFAIGVAATWITIAVRPDSLTSPTVSSNNAQTRPLAAVPARKTWPERRSLDLELFDDETLAYNHYVVKRRHKTVKQDQPNDEGERTQSLEVRYATLIHNGKVLETFDRDLYHPMGNSTTFGLFSLLGVRNKQLVVSQSIWRGGSYWIVNLSSRAEVVYSSGDWAISDDEIFAVDVDRDGVDEIVQFVNAFIDLQDKLPIGRIPLPEVIFKYDARAAKYLPANTLHKDYVLRQLEESDEKISAPSPNNFNHLAEVLKVVVGFVYAGEEQKGWEFYERVYQLSDKEEIRARVLAVLKEEPVYQFIYRPGGPSSIHK